jgi:predicted small lipoprotein YifL
VKRRAAVSSLVALIVLGAAALAACRLGGPTESPWEYVPEPDDAAAGGDAPADGSADAYALVVDP